MEDNWISRRQSTRISRSSMTGTCSVAPFLRRKRHVESIKFVNIACFLFTHELDEQRGVGCKKWVLLIELMFQLLMVISMYSIWYPCSDSEVKLVY